MPFPFKFTPESLISDVILGLNLLTGSLSADVVAVLDQESFQQVFPEARPLIVYPRETSRIMTHPLESGAMVADHKVIDPKTIELILLISSENFASAFQQVRSAYLNSTLLTVQTKAAVYQNMVIKSLPREETPDKSDITTISLQMEEAIFALPGGTSSTTSVSYYSPVNPLNASSVLRGLQSAVINPATALASIIKGVSVWGIRI